MSSDSLYDPQNEGGLTGFLGSLFAFTEHAVELRSCTNLPGGPGLSHFGRDPDDIILHLQRHDVLGRAMYIGLGTRRKGRTKGNRANVMENTCAWTDIDCLKLGLTKDEVRAKLQSCLFPPSFIVDSGGGLHSYWLFSEPLETALEVDGTDETEERLVSLNKQFCAVFAGDIKATDLSRVMRLPGSHNTKDETIEAHGGVAPLVKVVWPANFDDPAVYNNVRRYELSDLEDWLEYQQPLIEVEHPAFAEMPKTGRDAETGDPYADYARQCGTAAPLDVQAWMAKMASRHPGEHSIHESQLRISASLVLKGWTDDAIVEVLMARTREVAERDLGPKARAWNWRREERNIRRMCKDWRSKPDVKAKLAEKAAAEEAVAAYAVTAEVDVRGDRTTEAATGTDGATMTADNVVRPDFTRKDKAKGKKADNELVLPAIGEEAIALWQAEHGPLIAVDGTLWTYRDGFWTVFDERLTAALHGFIQDQLEATMIDPTPQKKNGVLSWISHCKAIRQVGVAWDATPLIVGRNGCLDPETGSIVPHSPTDYATRRVDVEFDATAVCPHWLRFLGDVFGCFGHQGCLERILTIQEWFGSLLAKGLTRDMKKVAWWWGDKRTGKSRFTRVACMLLGETAICSLHPPELEDRFGMAALLNSRAWIADDVLDEDSFIPGGKFKVIVTGEAVAVRQMNKVAITTVFDLPIAFSANDRPRFKDSTDACYDRILPIRLMRQFQVGEARSEHEIDAEFRAELPGIFNWAVEGLKRLRARGHYGGHEWMQQGQKEFKEGNTVLSDWAESCVERDESCRVEVNDLFCSMNGFVRAQYGPSRIDYGGKAISRALRNKYPDLGETQKSNGQFYYLGIRLTKDGDDFGRVERVRRGEEHLWQGTKLRTDTKFTTAQKQATDAAASAAKDRKPRF
jgi:P4 family phage/plasmid primase-like protien